MDNPYKSLPDHAYWRRAVGNLPLRAVDPVVEVPFNLSRQDRIATAGSCFAQHLARALKARGFDLMIEEPEAENTEDSPHWSAFSAAYGNLYTAAQLLQLFERAYGVLHPRDVAWRRPDGRYVDPFRPLIQQAGFDSPESVEAARRRHLAAVRTMFDTCDVFIFTLGLTESWTALTDGAAFPIPPGVEAQPEGEAGDYGFHNTTVAQVVADMRRFLHLLRTVNPGVRVILTVSPVSIIATYEPRHVLVSTVATKSILRAAADEICAGDPLTAYFPSYEIALGPHTRGAYIAGDLRTMTPEGVDRVMEVFARAYLSDAVSERPAITSPKLTDQRLAVARSRMEALLGVICDEDVLDPDQG